MSVTLEQVIQTLKKAYDEYYDGEEWVKKEFEEIATETNRRTLTVLGMGALVPEYKSKMSSFEGSGNIIIRKSGTISIIDQGVEVMEIK